jgi:hypothetical protein
MPTRFEQFYLEQYRDAEFRQTYLTARDRVYRAVAGILRRLRVSQVFDIGCSFGLLVERLNAAGVDAYGADLPLPEVQEFHGHLEHSGGKFLYGNATQMRFPIQPNRSAIVVLDSLRHFDGPGILGEQGAEYVLIKENGAKGWVARSRQPEDQVRFYSPADLLEAFPGYEALEIHATRYLFRLRKPGPLALAWFNYMPSFTLVLRRRDTDR